MAAGSNVLDHPLIREIVQTAGRFRRMPNGSPPLITRPPRGGSLDTAQVPKGLNGPVGRFLIIYRQSDALLHIRPKIDEDERTGEKVCMSTSCFCFPPSFEPPLFVRTLCAQMRIMEFSGTSILVVTIVTGPIGRPWAGPTCALSYPHFHGRTCQGREPQLYHVRKPTDASAP